MIYSGAAMVQHPTPPKGAVVGVDVGGTFTDLVELDQSSGRVRLAKVASTTDNQAFGVLNALDQAGCDLAALDLIVHGTTTTTNAAPLTLLPRRLQHELGSHWVSMD